MKQNVKINEKRNILKREKLKNNIIKERQSLLPNKFSDF
jgi:hypothetical protein